MDTNISAFMARIQQIRTRIEEIRGMSVPGVSPGRESAVQGPAADAAAGGRDFSALLEEALGGLGTGSAEAQTVPADAASLLSGALDSLSALNGFTGGADAETDAGSLMSGQNLARITELERILRGGITPSENEE